MRKFCSLPCKNKGMIGKIPWNKGKVGIFSEKTIKKIKLARSKQKFSKETREKLRKVALERNFGGLPKLLGKDHPQWKGGLPNCIECGKGLSRHDAIYCKRHAHSEERNHRWKNGITNENRKIRTSLEYKLWREAVFKRDNYTCQECEQIGKELQVDHIKPFALFPKLRLVLDNGRTLCKVCHLKTDTWGNRSKSKKVSVRSLAKTI